MCPGNPIFALDYFKIYKKEGEKLLRENNNRKGSLSLLDSGNQQPHWHILPFKKKKKYQRMKELVTLLSRQYPIPNKLSA